MSHKKDTKAALEWIVSVLKLHKVPFHVSGGFAARLYGSTRPLRDIDIEMPKKFMEKLLDDLQPYLLYGPEHYKDSHFDVPLMTVEYKGQKIDLSASDDLKLYDSRTHKWVKYPVNLKNSVRKKIFGMSIPVAAPESLMNYKSMMGEKVQMEDVSAIEEHL